MLRTRISEFPLGVISWVDDEKTRLVQALEGWRDEDWHRTYHLTWRGRGRWAARLEGPGFDLAFATPSAWGWHAGDAWTLDAPEPLPGASAAVLRVCALIRRLIELAPCAAVA